MNAHVKETSIQETYTLPSKGLLYEGIPSEITLRAMTTFEEKTRLSTNSFFKTMPMIINACIVDNDNLKIDAAKLSLFDMYFLMYKLRVVTYGPEYKLNLQCPTCEGNVDVIVNLDDLKCNEITSADDPHAHEPFSIGKLPVSGDSIECRYLTASDMIDIEREAKMIKKNSPLYVGEPDYLLSLQKKIVTINGEKLPPFRVQKYVETMNSKDGLYIDNRNAEINLGIQLSCIETCPKCLGDIEFILPMTSEFFRPTYNC
jgi:hypothetical protein